MKSKLTVIHRNREMNTNEHIEKMKKMLKACETIAISKKPKRQQLYKLYKLIMNRKMFEYGTRHAFEEYLKCLCYKS